MLLIIETSYAKTKSLFVQSWDDNWSTIEIYDINVNGDLIFQSQSFIDNIGTLDIAVDMFHERLYVRNFNVINAVNIGTIETEEFIPVIPPVQLDNLKWDNKRFRLYGFSTDPQFLLKYKWFNNQLQLEDTISLANCTAAYDGVIDYDNDLLFVNQGTRIVNIYNVTNLNYINSFFINDPNIDYGLALYGGVFWLESIDVHGNTMYSAGYIFNGMYWVYYFIKSDLQTGNSTSINSMTNPRVYYKRLAIDQESGLIYATNMVLECIDVYNSDFQLLYSTPTKGNPRIPEIGITWNKADYNRDSIVDFYDFTLLADAWKTENVFISLDDNNDVDINDVSELCEKWLH
jgi:hypothetical protein